jgi:uncharacterized membrane protein YhhN
MNAALILAAAILLALLLVSERRGNPAFILAAKAPLSVLFILAALLQPWGNPGYALMLLPGLVFCLGGDVFLALTRPRMFLLGLVCFLVGHLFYTAAFLRLSPVNPWTWGGLAACAVLSFAVFQWLRPRLGSLRGPVAAYVAVITLMAAAAFTVFGDGRIGLPGRTLVLAGALSFYLSDIFVARNRFVKPGIVNRLAGLPLYYLGQFLLAFSAGRIG